jgi:hypothetical protein
VGHRKSWRSCDSYLPMLFSKGRYSPGIWKYRLIYSEIIGCATPRPGTSLGRVTGPLNKLPPNPDSDCFTFLCTICQMHGLMVWPNTGEKTHSPSHNFLNSQRSNDVDGQIWSEMPRDIYSLVSRYAYDSDPLGSSASSPAPRWTSRRKYRTCS